MSGENKRFSSTSEGALMRWMEEFAEQCEEVWKNTTPAEGHGGWLSFNKLWGWKNACVN